MTGSNEKLYAKERLMKKRPMLTSVIGELTYDSTGAKTLRDLELKKVGYVIDPNSVLVNSPFLLKDSVLCLLGDNEACSRAHARATDTVYLKGNDTIVFEWHPGIIPVPMVIEYNYTKAELESKKNPLAKIPIIGNIVKFFSGFQKVEPESKYVLEQDYERGDLTKENKNARVFLASIPAFSTLTFDRQVLQDIAQEEAEKGNWKEVDKIRETWYQNFKENYEKSWFDFTKSRKLWWYMTSPYETRLVDNKLRIEIDPSLKRTHIRNVVSTDAGVGGLVREGVNKDKEFWEKEAKEHKIPRTVIVTWEIAGDVANNNAKWVRGLDVQPNVAPNWENVKLRDVAKWGPAVVIPSAVASSLLSGNLMLGLLLGLAGMVIVLFVWLMTKEDKEEKKLIQALRVERL